MGARAASLTIIGSDPVNPSLAVPLSGTGIAPVAVVAPMTLVYADQLLNTFSLAQAVVLSNTGTAPLLITSISLTGANPGDFIQSNACGSIMAVGANCAIVVTFRPLVLGARSSSLTIAGSDPVNPSVAVTLSGNGISLPARPTGLVATASPLSSNPPTVSLTWTDRSTNEVGFSIQRATNQNFTSGVTYFTVGANVTAFTDTTVLPHANYFYRVQAFVNGGASDWSNTQNVQTNGWLPATPTNLTFVGSTQTSITIGWTDNAANETGFRVGRSSAGPTGPWNTIATLPANTTTFTNTGMSPARTRWYRVRAYNADGNSTFSNVISGTTLP
jgi:hypothetical protein